MSVHQVLINGEWISSAGSKTFQATNPATKKPLEPQFPVSPWGEVETALQSAARAFEQSRQWSGARFADFLEAYANAIEADADAIVTAAHQETGYPVDPRLKNGELPRTTDQLRQAATAAREGSWRRATIDTQAGIRSMLAPLGPVAVFGPNNFPLAFNSIAGGDFAAAIAAGCPVIAKGHSSHPETTRLFAVAAQQAAEQTKMPAGFVQLIYRTSHEDGAKLISHPLIGATGYTGSRSAGLYLKEAADRCGKPIYLELSSVNPVFVLPGAINERLDKIADEFAGSCLLGSGQFCTNPGVVVLKAGPQTDAFVAAVAERFQQAPAGTLLSEGVEQSFRAGIVALQRAGAVVVTGNQPADGDRYCYANTLLRVGGGQFLADPHGLQEEIFGNGSLLVVADDDEQLEQIALQFEGNLTGCLYTDTSGTDDALYERIAPILRQKVGRLLNDKMPTGVAVSPAMNHGGPYPATGHSGFTAVGVPAAITRFAALHCYDNVRPHRLPAELADTNPGGMWRYVDRVWTQADAADVGSAD
jgi:2,5-dioxopentanoate dehydrogenase